MLTDILLSEMFLNYSSKPQIIILSVRVTVWDTEIKNLFLD